MSGLTGQTDCICDFVLSVQHCGLLDLEMNLHVKLCAGWGLLPSYLEQTPPACEMLAYLCYFMRCLSLMLVPFWSHPMSVLCPISCVYRKVYFDVVSSLFGQ